jgi:hypothetical protein
MADDAQPADVYADQFTVSVGPYGVSITFSLTQPHPAPGQPPQRRDLVTVRMSLEHTKVMAMILHRQLKNYERENSIEIPIPYSLYQQLGLAPEDW